MPKRRSAPAHTYWKGGILWGRVQVQGRIIQWSLRTDNPGVARSRVEARRQQEIAHAHYGDSRAIWDDIVVGWGQHISANVGPATARRYAVSLVQLHPFLHGCYIDEINNKLLADIVHHRRAAGVTNATIRRDLVALSSVLTFADVEPNPALAMMKRLKERRDPIVLPQPDHIRSVIKLAPGMMSALIHLAWFTGCRQNELVTLKRSQVDLPRRQVTVIGKGNKRRTLDLDTDALKLFASLPVNLATEYVFHHHGGAPYRNFSSRFRVIVKRAELLRKPLQFRPFRFHDLRHRYAVDYLQAGGSIYKLQQLLGHGSVKTTELYLQYLTPDEALKAKEMTA